jgi:UDP-GlcNAc:undecaprenyl-phosphate GlcNAc-1-phosphate transferase
MRALIAVVAASGVSLLVAYASARLAPRLGFVDVPDESLKTHRAPVPPVGGIGVYAGLHAGLLIAGKFDTGLFVATSVLLAGGLVDDRRGLPPWLRLGVEAGAGVALGVFATLLPGSLLARVLLGAILVPLIANAVNLIDGMDGLSGSTSLVTAIGLALLTLARWGRGLSVGAVLAWALAGFLVLNWRPARVFLGDGGAYVVGGALAYAMLASVSETVGYSPSEGLPMVLLATGMLGVIALDLGVTLLRRRASGRPLFAGDRSHLYDQLGDRGWSVTHVVVAAAAAQVFVVVGILFLDGRDRPWAAVAIAALAFLFALLGLTVAGFMRVDDAPGRGTPGYDED